MTDAQKEEARRRAGLVGIITTALLLMAPVVMQLVYPAHWPFWLAIAAIAAILALAIRARWVSRRHSRSGRSA